MSTFASTLEGHRHRYNGLLTVDQYYTGFKSVMIIRLIICLVGITTNSLCLRTFYRIGVEDSVTLIFFLQAVFDFGHLVIGILHAIASILEVVERHSSYRFIVEPKSMRVILNTVIRMILEPAHAMTTFLAFQRCLCVAIPLKVKGMFNRRRTCLIVIPVCLLAVIMYSLVLSQHRFELTRSSLDNNRTRYVVVYLPDRHTFVLLTYALFAIIFNLFNQITVTVCVIYMTRALMSSVRFRRRVSSMVYKSHTESVRVITATSTNLGDGDGDGGGDSSQSPSYAVSDTKERLVIQQVTLVCVIFLVSSMPRLVASFVAWSIPEFELGKRYMLSYILAYHVLMALEHMNSSANFFIYYKYNSKFRKACFRHLGNGNNNGVMRNSSFCVSRTTTISRLTDEQI